MAAWREDAAPSTTGELALNAWRAELSPCSLGWLPGE